MRPWLALPLLLLGRPLPDPSPQDLGMWYWHTPFRVSSEERATLRQMGVRTLYVRAVTFASDGKRAVPILPERWETDAPGLDVVLTADFDPGLVSHLEAIPVSKLADDVSRGLLEARRKARNVRFAGYQLDVDCPTRLLPRYADLLRQIRGRVGGPFSITALPTWLRADAFSQVAQAVDFVAPQFYESRIGRTLDTIQPVSDPESLRGGLARLRALGVPFRAGLAAYGHALLYDPKGRLAGIYRGLSPEDALRHPALRLQRWGDLGGERRLVLRAVAPDANGRGVGDRIAYVLPTPGALRSQLAIYRRDAPPNALGPILYRFPEPGEAMALALRTQAAALAERPAPPVLRPSLDVRAIPWALIAPGSQAGRPSLALRVRVASIDGPSDSTPDAVQVLVRLDHPGIEGMAPGDFDSVEGGTLDEKGRFVRGARVHADVVRLRRGSVLPGETLRSGPIETSADGATAASVEWAVKGPDGDARGSLPPRRLNDESVVGHGREARR